MNEEALSGGETGSLTELTGIEAVALVPLTLSSVAIADEVWSTVTGAAARVVVVAAGVVEEASCPAGVSSNGAESAGATRANIKNNVTVVNFILDIITVV